jgi:ribosome hibernation promoting factor
MDVLVTGKQIDVGDSLRIYVRDKLSAGVAKYFDQPVETTVTFSREAHQYRVDCSVHVAHNLFLRSHAVAMEIYACFDTAEERMEKRLRRYKGRFKRHRGAQRETGDEDSARDIILSADDEREVEPDSFQPVTIAETTTEIPTVTVGEAVMRLDMEELPALMFRNVAHGELNVVFRRADGNIGWIDPQGTGGKDKAARRTAGQ